ncbi:MAG: ABC transporter substrate-binding protein [Chloroflexota bacterium]|nr:extracellular solute-binding protein [Chloroflexota bacterium]NOG62727.1 extracellular solute-binding protein [Chloroflexota bacterium]GIK63064.1 MAG: ABC transporter substrate-binding protein [Chloroflexota bacterium]
MGKKRFPLILLIFFLLIGTMPSYGQGSRVRFVSTQFNTAEEGVKFREILVGYGDVEFIGQEEIPLLNMMDAEAAMGEGTIDVVGALHGTFPTLAENEYLTNLSGLLREIDAESDVIDDFEEFGQLGTANNQYYIPWMLATFLMAANVKALPYLPEGADINALTWDQLAEWGQNIYAATGEAKIGFPVDGLMHRFVQGYLYPSFTGGMVTNFRSPEAVSMFEFVRDDLWPYIHPDSLTYSFMHEPLLSGDVWIAFDHVARLVDAFQQRPDEFVAFPAPAGPAGRAYMGIIVGLAIPQNAPNPDGAEDLIRYLLSPEVQGQILTELGFFPVINNLNFTSLPEGIVKEATAVSIMSSAPDTIAGLSPVGLGDRANDVNQIYRDTFLRIVIDGENIQTVLIEATAELQAILNETGAPCWLPDPPSFGACQIK